VNRLRPVLIASSLLLLAAACDPNEKVAPPRANSEEASPKTSSENGASERFALAGLEHRVAVGSPATLELEVTPSGPLKINPEFPWKLTLNAPPDELGVAAPVVTRDAMTFGDKKATVPVAVAPSAAGDYTLEGTIDLSVCEADGAKRCFLERAKPVTLTIEAASQAAPTP
jgi:hypothetical protein